jgi:hypothetical protein
MFGKPVAAGVWQTGKSGPTNGGDMSKAVARAPAREMMFPAAKVASAAPPSAAAPAETNSLCDLVNVAMCVLQNRTEENLPNLDPTGRTERDPKKTPDHEY